MKTTVNGVEITPKIAEALSSWYQVTAVDPKTQPEIFTEWLSRVQDGLTSQMLGMKDLSPSMLKDYLCDIIYIKDELKKFIPGQKIQADESND